MNQQDIKRLTNRYFEGKTSEQEEQLLRDYFNANDVDDELKEFANYFMAIAELSAHSTAKNLNDEIMNHILEHEQRTKVNYLSLWKTVTSVAAVVIVVLGAILLWPKPNNNFTDSFNNPEEAQAYALETLSFVAQTYNKGMLQLMQFNKLSRAVHPLKEGSSQLAKAYNELKLLQLSASMSSELHPENTNKTDSSVNQPDIQNN